MRLLRCLLFVFLLSFISPSAHATMIVAYTEIFDSVIPLTTTNWNGSLTFSKFNASLGTLTGIYVELAGHVEGVAKFESRDAGETEITTNLTATLKLSRPGSPPGTTIVQVLPLASTSETVAAYDLVTDYGGPSGRTYNDLHSDLSTSVWLTSSGDLALFTGGGNILLPIKATANSTASGSGALISEFDTKASAVGHVQYRYQYETLIPEPVSMLLIGAGLIGIGLVSRRKKVA